MARTTASEYHRVRCELPIGPVDCPETHFRRSAMARRMNLTRRDILRSAVAGSVFPYHSMGRLFADEPLKSPSAPDRSLFLFLDWFHVKKGDLQVTLDPQRITPAGKVLLETYA